jgi:PAS domain S-box-containing protein
LLTSLPFGLLLLLASVFGPIVAFDWYLRRTQKHWTEIGRRKLHSEAARNQAIMATSLDAVIISDEDSIVVEWSPAAEHIFGYPKAEAMGHKLETLIIPAEYRERHARGMARYKETDTGTGVILGKRLQVTCIRKDQSRFPAEMVVNRIPFAYEGPAMFVGFIRDMSDTEHGTRHPAFVSKEHRVVVAK